ncbi:rCG30827 [Rattus norvegicus]|uniref:RCG30827 n=1 Tax=Rattus norvegicus TaxID=10116 RepID=A6IS43_RAT|nr:rCG30827 [Rattus norvegicus]
MQVTQDKLPVVKPAGIRPWIIRSLT